MNYCGSYRKLLGNSIAAIIAGIEIYNKPTFQYRDECFAILVLNAWELALKALLSKNHQSIYYRKRRNEPYRTLSWQDALNKAEKYFTRGLPALPVRKNLELLGTYRDNAVHFYNATGFGIILHSLAQTAVKNLRDLIQQTFGIQLEHEVNWQLLPLGISPPIDPVVYISRVKDGSQKSGAAVRQFVSELSKSVEEVADKGCDTGRLMTVFYVKLESTKKIEKADVTVGEEKAKDKKGKGPLAVVKVRDPNITHPLRQKDIIERIGTLHGERFSQYTFQAIVWKYNLKSNKDYCWQATEGVLTRYSNEIVAWIQRLSKADVQTALNDYRKHMAGKRKKSLRR